MSILAPRAFGQFHRLETDNLRLIYYTKIHEFIVPHTARCFENALGFHGKLFNYTPGEKVTVLMQDFRDYGYGGAETVPRNILHLGIAPFSYTYETMPANERMNWMMNHELVHIVSMDQAAGRDKFFRKLFMGKVAPVAEQPISMLYSYLTNPRRYTPRWYLEGSAVFLETWMAGGLGRALGAYDEMVFRSMVHDSSYFYDIVGLESEGMAIDFQVGVNAYLYGTRFMSYLAYKHGPEKLIQWIARTEGSKAYYASQFKKVYSVSLDDAWSRWIAWEQDWQKTNLQAIRKNPTTPYRVISDRTLGSVSRPFYDPDKRRLYTAVRYPGQIAHIAAIDIDTGELKKICNIKGAALYFVTSLAYDPSTKTLFYTSDNNGWRDLRAVDVETGKTRTLIKDVRTGDLAFNRADKSIWGVRHYNGISTVVRIPHPYEEWNQIHSFPYGQDIFDIDVSPDGSLLTGALAEISGRQKLIKMNIGNVAKSNGSLEDNDLTYEVLFDFENSLPANFVFSEDGRYLYGSSYYSGVSNIYRYDFETQEMEILSNCETGFFRPLPVSEDSLVVFKYSGKGFVPAMIPIDPPERVSAIQFLGNEIAKKYPLVRSWTVGSPAHVNIDSLTTFNGTYSTLGGIELDSGYPIVEGYKDFAAVGMRLNYSDALGLSGFDLTTSYSPDSDLPADERVHARLDFHHWQWHLTVKYNAGDFYDLFGPTKRSRKGYSVALRHKKTLLFDEPKTLTYSLDVAGYGNLETLPDYQNVAATFDKFLTAGASLDYEFVRRSLGAVDEEKGIKGQILSRNQYVNGHLFPQVYANFDYGVPLPINHSSIWLRTSLGQTFGDRDNPFANFFFGGFGNNWVDHLSEKRYRKYYSFPGVDLNAFGGRNYAKAILEWNLPPLRFRRLGFPALYFNWARFALFTSAIRTNLDARGGSQPLPQFGVRRTLANVGGQVDFRLVLFSALESTLSFGYAAAFEQNRPTEKEFMVSLKILR